MSVAAAYSTEVPTWAEPPHQMVEEIGSGEAGQMSVLHLAFAPFERLATFDRAHLG